MYINSLNSGEQRYARYLLGILSEEEALAVAETCFMDATARQALENIEMELSEAYVRKNLTEEEKQHFEAHFLCTESRWGNTILAAILERIRGSAKPE